MTFHRPFPAALLVAALVAPMAHAQTPSAATPAQLRRIDSIFGAYTATTPGCGVGVSLDGRLLFSRGYGAANLEYNVPITEHTVFESGSVAKQFTAAAIVQLALDGRLGLDDDVRKYVPEVPRFDAGIITLRHLLNHTSGLRDQWGLLGLEGRGPGSQVHTPATTIDLVARQRMLNFPPGARYLYSNTGYTLLGIVVARVSGQSLEQYMQDRFFRPMGLTRTGWREDHTTVVPGRATAYSPRGTGFRTNMPFTNMIGNGGLLFTVRDALRWTDLLHTPATAAGRALRDSLLVQGRLTNGRKISYALGIQVQSYAGKREIAHGGSTAGYQTYLAHYPESRLSVAVLCNGTNINPTALARQVADLFLPRSSVVNGIARGRAVQLPAEARQRWVGMYRDETTDQVVRVQEQGDSLLFDTNPGAQPLVTTSPDQGRAGTAILSLHGAGGDRVLSVVRNDDDTTAYRSVPPPSGPAALDDYVGTYVSDELDVRLSVVRDGDRLVVTRRPADRSPLTAVYRDGFSGPIGNLRFTRDSAGRVTGFAIFAGRVLDVRFARVSDGGR